MPPQLNAKNVVAMPVSPYHCAHLLAAQLTRACLAYACLSFHNALSCVLHVNEQAMGPRFATRDSG
jgi:hypothetical protein